MMKQNYKEKPSYLYLKQDKLGTKCWFQLQDSMPKNVSFLIKYCILKMIFQVIVNRLSAFKNYALNLLFLRHKVNKYLLKAFS